MSSACSRVSCSWPASTFVKFTAISSRPFVAAGLFRMIMAFFWAAIGFRPSASATACNDGHIFLAGLQGEPSRPIHSAHHINDPGALDCDSITGVQFDVEKRVAGLRQPVEVHAEGAIARSRLACGLRRLRAA